MGENFREDIKIDKYALDTAALLQPELFAEWAEKWANAVRTRDQLKDKLALVRGTCDQDIRENPAAFGWDKEKSPTEAFITSAIITHGEYVDANKDYNEAQHQVNIMQVAKEAFEHRRRMIELLVSLYNSSYFSGNKKFDVGYQEVLPAAVAEAQNAGLEASPRLARRKPPEA